MFRSGGDTLTGMIFDLASLWVVAIPLALLGTRVLHVSFLGVVILAYLGEDIPKSILCLLHFRSMRWLKPVTEEGRAGLKARKNNRRTKGSPCSKGEPLPLHRRWECCSALPALPAFPCPCPDCIRAANLPH